MIPLSILAAVAVVWVLALLASSLALVALIAGQTCATWCRATRVHLRRRLYHAHLAEARKIGV